MSYINIAETGTDHTIWMRGLEFYRDELDLMQIRLTGISGKNTSEEVGKGVEHFQNQIMIQQKNINDLKHEVRNFVKGLSNDAKGYNGQVDEIYLKQSRSLKERYEQQEQIMNSLRHEFNNFLSKRM